MNSNPYINEYENSPPSFGSPVALPSPDNMTDTPSPHPDDAELREELDQIFGTRGMDQEQLKSAIAILIHRYADQKVVAASIAAFKKSTNQNVDGSAKYWSGDGDYNADAMTKFFPQEWFDEKFMPALEAELSTKAKEEMV